MIQFSNVPDYLEKIQMAEWIDKHISACVPLIDDDSSDLDKLYAELDKAFKQMESAQKFAKVLEQKPQQVPVSAPSKITKLHTWGSQTIKPATDNSAW
jgi:hypothetical protein